MKKLVCLMLLALFSISAVAAESSGQTKLFLTTPAQLAGKPLPPGEYKMQWSGDQNDLKVVFLIQNKEVASAQGKLVNRDHAVSKSAVLKREDGTIRQVWFGGKKMMISFE